MGPCLDSITTLQLIFLAEIVLIVTARTNFPKGRVSMFESIVFKNSYTHDQNIDIGALAESLIFYGKVKIVGNQGTLKFLLKKILINQIHLALKLMWTY